VVYCWRHLCVTETFYVCPEDFRRGVLCKEVIKWAKYPQYYLQRLCYFDNMNTQGSPKTSDKDDTLYIHWSFHPSDISQNTVRIIYNKILNGFDDGFQLMMLVISWPKNLSDILCKIDLPHIIDRNVSNILQQILDMNTTHQITCNSSVDTTNFIHYHHHRIIPIAETLNCYSFYFNTNPSSNIQIHQFYKQENLLMTEII